MKVRLHTPYCFAKRQKSIDALTQIFFAQIASNEPFENEEFFSTPKGQ
jgi:hypothetical protein